MNLLNFTYAECFASEKTSKAKKPARYRTGSQRNRKLDFQPRGPCGR